MGVIRELKVKQSDGTFGDAIPLGTKASYILKSDGSALEDSEGKLNIAPSEIGTYTKGQIDDLNRQLENGGQGWYATGAELNAAEDINPGIDGWWAIVGETNTIWKWDTSSNKWVDSNQTTALAGYYTQSQIDDQFTAHSKNLTINGKTYNGTSAVNVGAIGASYGGTGKTTLKDSENALVNALAIETTTPADADYYIGQVASGGASDTTYRRKTMSALWEYIKSKISSILGLTSTNYEGTAAAASKLSTSRTISLTGSATGSGSFDGSGDLSISTSINTATQDEAGLLSASDKTKLDGLEASTTYTLTVYASSWSTYGTSGTDSYYRCAVSCSGMTSSIQLSCIELVDSYKTSSDAVTAFQTWSYLSTATNYVYFYSATKPTTTFAITAIAIK